MSLREKSAWISVLGYLLVYGWYFTVFGSALLAGRSDGSDFLGLLIGAVFALVLLEIALHVAVVVYAAVRDPDEVAEPVDERERLIALKASRPARTVLSMGVLTGIAALYFDAGRYIVINELFLTLVIAEIVRCATQIVLFRRGG